MFKSLFVVFAFIPGVAFGASIPQGAQRVNLGMYTFTAPCTNSVALESVTLKHSGLGDTSDIERVYLAEGIRRISPARSFTGREKTAELRLRGLTIAKCTTRTFSVLADFSSVAQSGGEHRIDIDHVDTASGSITVAKSTGGVRAQTTPASSGTVSVEYRDLLSPVRFGNSRTILRFVVSADGDEHQQINAITFTNKGSARDGDIQRLRLFDGNEQLAATVNALDGDIVRFELDPPLKLDRNAEKLLTVKADIKASRRRTIQLTIDEPSDIEAMRQQRSR